LGWAERSVPVWKMARATGADSSAARVGVLDLTGEVNHLAVLVRQLLDCFPESFALEVRSMWMCFDPLALVVLDGCSR
jgi:hypothetical protein